MTNSSQPSDHGTFCGKCRRDYSRDQLILADSTLNHEFGDSLCSCWMCVDCWTELYENNEAECPLCQNDISEFLEACYSSDSDSD